MTRVRIRDISMDTRAKPIDTSKEDSLRAAVDGIERSHGVGALISPVQSAGAPIDVISTGSLKLDRALGVGGLPRGRLIEVFGCEMSGKTTVALQVIAQAQRSGGRAAFIDAEHALDMRYAKGLGVDLEALLVAQPDNGEQAIDITERLLRSGAIDVVVIDSVAALTPKAELEAGMAGAEPGLHARLMSRACRALAAVTQHTNAVVIFINQLRLKIGAPCGASEVTTGGNALKFYASVRIDIRRTGTLKHGQQIVGHMARAKVVKNKVAAPFRQAEFALIFGRGIWRPAELIDLGMEAGVICKSEGDYLFGKESLGIGKQGACMSLERAPEQMAALEAAVREAFPGQSNPVQWAEPYGKESGGNRRWSR